MFDAVPTVGASAQAGSEHTVSFASPMHQLSYAGALRAPPHSLPFAAVLLRC